MFIYLSCYFPTIVHLLLEKKGGINKIQSKQVTEAEAIATAAHPAIRTSKNVGMQLLNTSRCLSSLLFCL